MHVFSQLLISLVALIYAYIVWLEMFAWVAREPKVFKSPPAVLFPATKTLAGNQGLYNGFLVAGMEWALLVTNPAWHHSVGTFFLGYVAVAGLYGAATAGAFYWGRRCRPRWRWRRGG